MPEPDSLQLDVSFEKETDSFTQKWKYKLQWQVSTQPIEAEIPTSAKFGQFKIRRSVRRAIFELLLKLLKCISFTKNNA